MSLRLLTIGLLLIGLPTIVNGESNVDGEQPTLKLMTYNIRYANPGDGEDVWANRRDAVGQVIETVDIVGLQEVTASQLNDVRQRTERMTWYGVGRDDGGQGGEACPIGFRTARFKLLESDTFWLSPTPTKIGSEGWDAALPRIASWVRLKDRQSGTQWLIVNTHFDHRGRQARLESARLIHQQIQTLAGDDRVVVMGDLNTSPQSEPLQALLATEGSVVLKNSRSVSLTPPSGATGTWNGFKAIAENSRIDFVLVGAGVTVRDHQTLDPKTAAGRFASDHQPVQVTILGGGL